MSEINVVPYIDVMLVLLVIFMATAPMLMQGVEIALPQADSEPLPDAQREDPMIVSVRADGSIWVNFGAPESATDPGAGTRVSPGALTEQATQIVRTRPDLPVFVRADTALAYGRVIEVMSILQRAGVANVGLVTDPVDLSRLTE
ncbi:MAG: protein TolR [Gammaproteobacteria bacterium]|nr:MAG: protein TolR [Gammaproteobacteria bacterium]